MAILAPSASLTSPPLWALISFETFSPGVGVVVDTAAVAGVGVGLVAGPQVVAVKVMVMTISKHKNRATIGQLLALSCIL
ncbi:MAG: hypothetical protein L6435_04110 [Anaerolineae bacterium]|nr:hypothetical protein [Anaerolineae bacterium]